MAEKIKIDGTTTLVPYYDNTYKADKLFLSAVKEEEWLNKLAAKGYHLRERKFSGYIFETDRLAGAYYYSVCVFHASAESEVSEAIIEKRARADSRPFYTYGNKAYYKTLAKHSELTAGVAYDAETKRCHLRNVFIFNLSMLCFWLGLLCYNLIYWVRFDSAGVLDTEKSGILWRFTIDMSSLFGNYPTTPYISLFIVLSLIFLPFTIYFLDQYLYSRRFEKVIKSQCEKE